MPPNNPNTEVTLDTENREAAALSVRQQWNTLRHLLHLPSMIELQDDLAQTEVCSRLTDLIARTRGPIANAGGLNDLLWSEFTNERNHTNPSNDPATSLGAMEERGLAIAEAWLNVIYRNIERRDIEELVDELPASIRPVVGGNTWSASCCLPGGVAPVTVTIDLHHALWRMGSVAQIEQRLLGLTPSQAGILGVGTARLTGPVITAIFQQLINRVIDPRLPTATHTFQGIPINGQRSIIQLPALLRDHPEFAEYDEAAFQVNLHAIQDDYIACVDEEGNPFPISNAITDAVVTGLFALESRDPLEPFAAIDESLQRAIEERQPIDQLLQGSADSRELMLALSALQADPSAARGLINSQTAGLDAARSRFTREKNIRSALTQLCQLKIPVRNSDEIQAAITHTLILPTPTPSAVQAKQNSIEMLQKEMDNYSQCVGLNTQIYALAYEIPSFRDELAPHPRRLARLHDFGRATPPPLEPIMAQGFSPMLIVNELESAFACIDDTTGAKSSSLNTIEHYDDQLRQNQEARTAAGSERTGDSNACWQVIRARLEDQGMRGPQLESTLQYMRSQLQKTPESRRDVEELTNTLYHYEGDDNHHAQEHWEQGKRHGGSIRAALRHPWRHYCDRLLSRDFLGFTNAELRNSRGRAIPLPRLLDAYFSLKYLSEDIPASDSRHLPESVGVVSLLRTMHQAILDRAAETFSSATGMNEAEQRQVGITAEMSLTEKLQQAQSFLTTGKQAYIARNKYRIDKISERAYEPIRTALENRTAFFDSLFKGKTFFDNHYLPVGIVARPVRLSYQYLAKPLVVGGSWKNPAAWVSNSLQGGSKFIWRLLNTTI